MTKKADLAEQVAQHIAAGTEFPEELVEAVKAIDPVHRVATRRKMTEEERLIAQEKAAVQAHLLRQAVGFPDGRRLIVLTDIDEIKKICRKRLMMLSSKDGYRLLERPTMFKKDFARVFLGIGTKTLEKILRSVPGPIAISAQNRHRPVYTIDEVAVYARIIAATIGTAIVKDPFPSHPGLMQQLYLARELIKAELHGISEEGEIE